MLLALGPIVLATVVWLIARMIVKRTGGYAPGWQVRCTKCGKTRDAGEVGVIRIGAASIGKVTFGRCSNCRAWRWIKIERKPKTQ
jgi:hypothetical protein